MASCTGLPGLTQCKTCKRQQPAGLLRPVAALTKCALYEPDPRREAMARANLMRPDPKLAPFAGRDERP
jgi:hypothetical protein